MISIRSLDMLSLALLPEADIHEAGYREEGHHCDALCPAGAGGQGGLFAPDDHPHLLPGL